MPRWIFSTLVAMFVVSEAWACSYCRTAGKNQNASRAPAVTSTTSSGGLVIGKALKPRNALDDGFFDATTQPESAPESERGTFGMVNPGSYGD